MWKKNDFKEILLHSNCKWQLLESTFFFFLPELFFIYKSRIVLTYSISGDKRLTLSFTVLNLSEPLLTSLLHIYQTTTSDKQ